MDGRRAIFADDYLVRYVIHLLLQPGWWFVFSLLEKSSWLLSLRVAFVAGCFEVVSSACGIRSRTLGEDLATGQLWPGRSAVKVHI